MVRVHDIEQRELWYISTSRFPASTSDEMYEWATGSPVLSEYSCFGDMFIDNEFYGYVSMYIMPIGNAEIESFSPASNREINSILRRGIPGVNWRTRRRSLDAFGRRVMDSFTVMSKGFLTRETAIAFLTSRGMELPPEGLYERW